MGHRNPKSERCESNAPRLMGDAISFLLSELRSPHLLSLIPDKHVVGAILADAASVVAAVPLSSKLCP